MFRVISIPLIVLAQAAFYRTSASLNTQALSIKLFDLTIYKVAMLGLYIPDMLLFLSAYLFCKKCLAPEASDPLTLLKHILRKIISLYPMYVFSLVIYWLLNPYLHSSPIWHIYQQQTVQCDSQWWRTLLLIDNLDGQSCFVGGWFVEADIQMVIVGGLLCFLYKRLPRSTTVLAGMLICGSLVWNEWRGVQVPLIEMINLDSRFRSGFVSTASHAPYYLMGVTAMFLRNFVEFELKETELEFIKPFTSVVGVLTMGLVSSCSQGVSYSQSQLFTFVGFLLLAVPFLIKESKNRSSFHKISRLSYHITLLSTIVTMTSVWASYDFMYLSNHSLLNTAITETVISALLGAGSALLLYPLHP